MKNTFGLLVAICLLAIPALAGFQGYNGTTDLKVFNKIQCDSGSGLINCTKVGDKFKVSMPTTITGNGTKTMYGFLQNRLKAFSGTSTATNVSATLATCGSTYYNSGAVQVDLPQASAVTGCRYTFAVAMSNNFDVNPYNGDQILLYTNAVGDMVRNATPGNSVTIQAISGSAWTVIGGTNASSGTAWTDAN